MFENTIDTFFNEMRMLHDQLNADMAAYRTCVTVGLDDAAIESLGGASYLKHLHIGALELNGKSPEAKRAIYIANLWTMIKTGLQWVWKKICEFCQWLMGLVTRWITNLMMPTSKASAATLNAFDKMPEDLMCANVLVRQSVLDRIQTLSILVDYFRKYTSEMNTFVSSVDSILDDKSGDVVGRFNRVLSLFKANPGFSDIGTAKSNIMGAANGVRIVPGSKANEVVITVPEMTVISELISIRSAGWSTATDIKTVDSMRTRLFPDLKAMSADISNVQKTAGRISNILSSFGKYITTGELTTLTNTLIANTTALQTIIVMVGSCIAQCCSICTATDKAMFDFRNNVTVAFDQYIKNNKK